MSWSVLKLWLLAKASALSQEPRVRGRLVRPWPFKLGFNWDLTNGVDCPGLSLASDARRAGCRVLVLHFKPDPLSVIGDRGQPASAATAPAALGDGASRPRWRRQPRQRSRQPSLAIPLCI